jgi:uncharacterized protein (TIGR04551 family)
MRTCSSINARVLAFIIVLTMMPMHASVLAQAPSPEKDREASEATADDVADQEDEPAAVPAPAAPDSAPVAVDAMFDELEDAGDDDELSRLIEEASLDSSLDGWTDRQSERPPTYPRFDHHGYFRFRADVFWNGHLGLSLDVLDGVVDDTVTADNVISSTAIPAPLRESWVNNQGNSPFFAATNGNASNDARTLASANIRFRYQPTLHISQSMRIHATFDVLDNVVLGSTPDFSPNLQRPDVPLVAFATSQGSPTAGINGFKDSVAVKEAYAEWQPAFLLRAGRMASHWGLGIIANGGKGIDDDYGDYADRVLLGLKLYGVYVFAAYDFVYSGLTTDSHHGLFGQPMDLGTDDDVKQAVLAVFQRPLSAEEKAQREVSYREKFEPIFDWGFYGVFRSQRWDYQQDDYNYWYGIWNPADAYDDGGGGGYSDDNYGSVYLVDRDAWAFVPDLWFRYMQRFDYFSGLRIELEAAGVFGDFRYSDDATTTSKKKLQQFGFALEAEYDWKELTIGLNTGMATGDDSPGFCMTTTCIRDGDQADLEVTNFKFDRNYHVDLLMFREMIGTVTKSLYVKPYIAYDLFDSVEDALGARLDIVYGHSLSPESLDSKDPSLGLEFDLSLFYEEKGRFNLDLQSGLMIPFAGFASADSNGVLHQPKDVAFTFQARMTMQF